MDIPESIKKKVKATIWFMILFNKKEAKVFDTGENYFITSQGDLDQTKVKLLGSIERGKKKYYIFQKSNKQ